MLEEDGTQNTGARPNLACFIFHFPELELLFNVTGLSWAGLGWAGRGAVLKLQLSTMVELYANTATTGYYAAAACLFDVTQCVFAETSR